MSRQMRYTTDLWACKNEPFFLPDTEVDYFPILLATWYGQVTDLKPK